MSLKKFIQERSEVNELAFNGDALEKVVKLYSSIMGKQMGGVFKILGLEEFKRKTGPGRGYRVMNEKGEQLRFNWDEKLAKKANFELTSIDYWNGTDFDFQKPTRTVMFAPELNVIQVLSKITDALKSGSIRESVEIIVEANDILLEKRSGKEKQEWLLANGMAKSLANYEDEMIRRADQNGLGEAVRIFLGQDETNSFEGELKKTDKLLDSTVYADPETVFEDIEDLLSLVATGKWRTLVVCGQGGIGKTFHITEGDRSLSKLLGPVNDKWTYHSGTKAAPFSLYKTLFQERKQVIVFDEADSLLKNKDIIMMLKPILDTSGDNTAEYMSGTKNMVGKSTQQIKEECNYVDMQIAGGAVISTSPQKNVVVKDDGSDVEDDNEDNDREEAQDKGLVAKSVQLPSKFIFEGAMIFISNMKASEIEGAIMSRSIFIDVYLAEQDIIKRIRTITKAQAKGWGITEEQAEAIVNELSSGSGAEREVKYMTPEYARKTKQLTVRSAKLAAMMMTSGLTRWKHLAALYA